MSFASNYSGIKRILHVFFGLVIFSPRFARPLSIIDCEGVGDIRIGVSLSELGHSRIIREFAEPTNVGGQTHWATVRLNGQLVDVELNPARAIVRIKLEHGGSATRANIGVGSGAAEAAKREVVSAVAGDGQERF